MGSGKFLGSLPAVKSRIPFPKNPQKNWDFKLRPRAITNNTHIILTIRLGFWSKKQKIHKTMTATTATTETKTVNVNWISVTLATINVCLAASGYLLLANSDNDLKTSSWEYKNKFSVIELSPLQKENPVNSRNRSAFLSTRPRRSAPAAPGTAGWEVSSR